MTSVTAKQILLKNSSGEYLIPYTAKAETDLSNISAIGLGQYNAFCINTGEVDTDGNPAFLSLTDGVLTTSGNFTATTASGKIYPVTDTLTLDVSDYSDGEYNVYINPVDLTISVLDNVLTTDKAFPADAVSGDYLINISQVPYDLQELTDSGTTTGLNEVFAGTLTISSGEGSLTLNDYNTNLELNEALIVVLDMLELFAEEFNSATSDG